MTDKEILRELASLPPEGQRQVAEFIAFLRERYNQSQQTGKPEITDLAQENFIGMWREREDMQDSSAWVRSSREREWMKQRG
ncbi:MAG TPA: hypothetical protein VF658_00325 [Pyrinomonadaceae bacterium]|jgi:hypothetical protein